jgi:hypothetical protein
MVMAFFFIIFYLIKKVISKRNKRPLTDSIISEENNSVDFRSPQNEKEENRLLEEIQPQTKLFKCVSFCTSIFYYLFWVVSSFLFLVFYMFGYFGRSSGIDVLNVLALTLIVVAPTILWKYFSKSRNLNSMKK